MFGNAISLIKKWFSKKQESVEEAEQLKRGVGQYSEAAFFADYGLAGVYSFFNISKVLIERYRDYDEMVAYPEIAAALDIYADNICQPDMFTGKTVWISSDDLTIKDKLTKFLESIGIEDQLWQITRDVCKYGNWFVEVLASPDKGVVGINSLPVYSMRVVRNDKGRIIGYYQDLANIMGSTDLNWQDYLKFMNEGKSKTDRFILFKPTEIIHFYIRPTGDSMIRGYGESILESSRWLFRRLLILEDSVIIYRLTRSPQRYVVYVDVGNMSPHEVQAALEKVKNEFNKKKFIDPNTGKLTSRYSPLSSDENFYVAVHGEKDQTRIEALSVPVWDYITDVEYFYNKIFTALKIPKAYLTYESEERVRSILALKDVNFSRNILRIQSCIKQRLKDLCNLYLASINIAPDSVRFSVEMTSPGQIYELMQAEVMKNRIELANDYSDWVSREWILRNILKFSDREIAEFEGKVKEVEGGKEVKEYTDKSAISDVERAVDELNKLTDKIRDLSHVEDDNRAILNEVRGLRRRIEQIINGK